MTKPKLWKTIENAWGIPMRVRNFNTDDALHDAMRDYADSPSVKPATCKGRVVFKDGTDLELELFRETKLLEFKDYDGDIWEKEYCGPKWQVGDDLNSEETLSTSPKKAILKWIPEENQPLVERIEIEP